MRIVFMGTPAFAVPSLAALYEAGYDIVGVVTAPDKPGGRKGTQVSAVKQFALEHGLKTLQPDKLKNSDFLDALRALRADLQVVVAFRMLPEVVWNMPPMGTLNLHGSLLPKYRGAAPINWAIIRGEQETGLSTFLLQHEIDTGDLLLQKCLPIGSNETAGELHDRMMEAGADLVVQTVQAMVDGSITPMPQDPSQATHAPKIFTETCEINFNQPAQGVHNFVRGLSPHPAAWTTLEGKHIKILRTLLTNDPASINPVPGNWYSDGKTYLKVGTADGFIDVDSLQMEGKRAMSVRDFLNGYKATWLTF